MNGACVQITKLMTKYRCVYTQVKDILSKYIKTSSFCDEI